MAQYQAHEEDKSDGGGWGQFLDGPRPHRQIGLYGTSAGLLVLSLANRDSENPCTSGATKLLSGWWADKSTGYGKTKFPQNPRLAFLALCLRNTAGATAQAIANKAEQELVTRASSKGTWGDYWVEKAVQDTSPRYLSTALSTLSLSILTQVNSDASAYIEKACEFLEQTLTTNHHLTTTEKGLLAAAIIAGSSSVKNRKTAKAIRSLAREPLGTLSQNHAYFYEYRYFEAKDSEIQWNRDSVYLYSEIMIGIAGFLPKAPAELRLRAEGILTRVLENVSTHGSFQPLHDGRLSTVEQAWCSVLLALARRRETVAKPGWNGLGYALVRQRPPNRFYDVAFPVVAMLAVATLSALPVTSFWFGITKASVSLLVYSLYGEKFFRRIFPGRN